MKSKHFLFMPLVALCVTSCATGVRHDISEYVLSKTLSLNSNNEFRILQLTDLHIGDKDYQDIHYKFLDKIIDDAKSDGGVDFIAVTGDLFTVASRSTAKRMINYFNSKKTPWTVTFGNHDEQCYFSVDWLTEQLNTAGQYCYFKDIQDDDISGNANFAINIMDGSDIFEQLIVMDSNRYCYGPDYIGYDYFKQNQIDWYSRLIDYTSSLNAGVTVPSLMFYHIPLPEVNDAWANKDTSSYFEGEKREKSCPPDYNSGFFKVIKDKASTRGMFFGHDHLNNFVVEYEGVYFGYGIKSTDRVYFDEDMMGGRVITIKNDHSLEFTSYYHTYKEVM